ncbi:hypothetical protein CSUI_008580, partial [Cystoisospora suis]
ERTGGWSTAVQATPQERQEQARLRAAKTGEVRSKVDRSGRSAGKSTAKSAERQQNRRQISSGRSAKCSTEVRKGGGTDLS